MGLDMYLEKRRYLSSYSDADKELIQKLNELFGITSNDVDTHVKAVTIRAGYWRKCNQIHKWFVDNVQDGGDECQESIVSDEQLKTLYDLVCNAIETKDASLLPPQSGFFFGSTEIDEYYWKGLEDTKAILERELAFIKSKSGSGEWWDYIYQANW